MNRALGLFCLIVLTGCTRLFFYPSEALFYRPEDVGARRYETVTFKRDGGPHLTGFFFPAVHPPAKGTVLHFHGNAQNITTHFLSSYWLKDHGYNVFIFDYRGYGASQQRRLSVRGAIEDCQSALYYIRSRSDVDPDKIAVFGQSLGGSLAITALARMPSPGVRTLIIDGSFSSYSSIARDKIKRIWPLRPLRWPLSLALFTTRYHPARHIKKLSNMPLLFVHGDKDNIVPYSEGRWLYEMASGPKTFWTVENGGHTEAFSKYGAIYRPKLIAYLDAVFSDGGSD